MHSFLSKVFGRKKEDKETSPTTLRPGELLDGKFEAVSPNVSPSAANFLELDPQAQAERAKDNDKDVGFSLFRAKSRPSPPEIRGRKPDTLPHLSLSFNTINEDSNATGSDSLFALDLNSQILLSDAIIGRRRLNPLEALVLIRACSQAIVSRGLETLGIMHPHWYSASPDVQRRLISQFIHSMEPKTPPTAFSPNSAISSPFESEINFTRSPHDVAAVLRWGLRHVQLEGDSFGTDDGWYKAFLDAEAAAEYPPKAFSEKLAPLLPPAHLELLIATLEIFSSLASHSEVNSTSGSKLSKIFGLWLLTARQVEDKDDWQTFYARWERTGRMLEHLFLSRIRDESTDQRMPVRLLELVRRYPYTLGLSSPTTDLQLLPPPRFTTQPHDAFFVRIEVELPSERRKPKLKVHPLNILADAFSTKVEEGEFAELWAKITATSKNGSNPSPLSNIFADETIRFLSIIPDKGKSAEVKSPAFSLLPVSPSSPRGQSFSNGDTDKPAIVQHPKSATEPSPVSAASPYAIGSDWVQFSSSGFLDTTPAIAPLVSTLFDTDIEKTIPAITTLSRKSSKRTKAASRKSVDFSSDPVKPIPEVQEEVVKKEPVSVVKATKLQIIQVDEAFIDFWSDSLLDPITATWPTFIICKFKSTLVPQLVYGPVEDGKQKTLKWLVLEQVITVKPPPAPTPAPLASPSVSISETARPVSPALSTSGRNRFSFWNMSRTASSSSQSSQKGKKKEKAPNVGEMGELLEEEATHPVEADLAKKKSTSKSRKSTTEKPKETTQKPADAVVAPAAAPASGTEVQNPVADKVASAEIDDFQDRSEPPGLSAPLAVAATAAFAAAGIATVVASQIPDSEVTKEEPISESAETTAQPQAEAAAQDIELPVATQSDLEATPGQHIDVAPVENVAPETTSRTTDDIPVESVAEAVPEAQIYEITEVTPAPVEPEVADNDNQVATVQAIEESSVEKSAPETTTEDIPVESVAEEAENSQTAEALPAPVESNAIDIQAAPVQSVEDSTIEKSSPDTTTEDVPVEDVIEAVPEAEVSQPAEVIPVSVDSEVVDVQTAPVHAVDDSAVEKPSPETTIESIPVESVAEAVPEAEISQTVEATPTPAESDVIGAQVVPAQALETSAVEESSPEITIKDIPVESVAEAVSEAEISQAVEATPTPVESDVVDVQTVPGEIIDDSAVDKPSLIENIPVEPIAEAISQAEISQPTEVVPVSVDPEVVDVQTAPVQAIDDSTVKESSPETTIKSIPVESSAEAVLEAEISQSAETTPAPVEPEVVDVQVPLDQAINDSTVEEYSPKATAGNIPVEFVAEGVSEDLISQPAETTPALVEPDVVDTQAAPVQTTDVQPATFEDANDVHDQRANEDPAVERQSDAGGDVSETAEAKLLEEEVCATVEGQIETIAVAESQHISTPKMVAVEVADNFSVESQNETELVEEEDVPRSEGVNILPQESLLEEPISAAEEPVLETQVPIHLTHVDVQGNVAPDSAAVEDVVEVLGEESLAFVEGGEPLAVSEEDSVFQAAQPRSGVDEPSSEVPTISATSILETASEEHSTVQEPIISGHVSDVAIVTSPELTEVVPEVGPTDPVNEDESNDLPTQAEHVESSPTLSETSSQKESTSEVIPITQSVTLVEEEIPTESVEEGVSENLREGEEKVHHSDEASGIPLFEEHSTDAAAVVEQPLTEAPLEPVNIASSIPTVVSMVLPEDSAAEAGIDLAPVPLVATPIEPIQGSHVTVPVEYNPIQESDEVGGLDTTLDADISTNHGDLDAVISAGSTPGPQTSLGAEIVDLKEVELSPVSGSSTATEKLTRGNEEPEELPNETEGISPSAAVEDNETTPMLAEEISADNAPFKKSDVAGLTSEDVPLDSVDDVQAEDVNPQEQVNEANGSSIVEHQEDSLQSPFSDSAEERQTTTVEEDDSTKDLPAVAEAFSVEKTSLPSNQSNDVVHEPAQIPDKIDAALAEETLVIPLGAPVVSAEHLESDILIDPAFLADVSTLSSEIAVDSVSIEETPGQQVGEEPTGDHVANSFEHEHPVDAESLLETEPQVVHEPAAEGEAIPGNISNAIEAPVYSENQATPPQEPLELAEKTEPAVGVDENLLVASEDVSILVLTEILTDENSTAVLGTEIFDKEPVVEVLTPVPPLNATELQEDGLEASESSALKEEALEDDAAHGEKVEEDANRESLLEAGDRPSSLESPACAEDISEHRAIEPKATPEQEVTLGSTASSEPAVQQEIEPDLTILSTPAAEESSIPQTEDIPVVVSETHYPVIGQFSTTEEPSNEGIVLEGNVSQNDELTAEEPILASEESDELRPLAITPLSRKESGLVVEFTPPILGENPGDSPVQSNVDSPSNDLSDDLAAEVADANPQFLSEEPAVEDSIAVAGEPVLLAKDTSTEELPLEEANNIIPEYIEPQENHFEQLVVAEKEPIIQEATSSDEPESLNQELESQTEQPILIPASTAEGQGIIEAEVAKTAGPDSTVLAADEERTTSDGVTEAKPFAVAPEEPANALSEDHTTEEIHETFEEPTEPLDEDVPSQENVGTSVEKPEVGAAVASEKPLGNENDENRDLDVQLVPGDSETQINRPELAQEVILSEGIRVSPDSAEEDITEPQTTLSAEEPTPVNLKSTAVDEPVSQQDRQPIVAEQEDEETPETTDNLLVDESIEQHSLPSADGLITDEITPVPNDGATTIDEEPVAVISEEVSTVPLEQEPSSQSDENFESVSAPPALEFAPPIHDPVVEEAIPAEVAESIPVDEPTATIDEVVSPEASSEDPNEALDDSKEAGSLDSVQEPPIRKPTPAVSDVVELVHAEEPSIIIDETIPQEENHEAAKQSLEDGPGDESLVSGEVPAATDTSEETATSDDNVEDKATSGPRDSALTEPVEPVVEEDADHEAVIPDLSEESKTIITAVSNLDEQHAEEESVSDEIAEPAVQVPEIPVNGDVSHQESFEASNDAGKESTETEPSVPTEGSEPIATDATLAEAVAEESLVAIDDDRVPSENIEPEVLPDKSEGSAEQPPIEMSAVEPETEPLVYTEQSAAEEPPSAPFEERIVVEDRAQSPHNDSLPEKTNVALEQPVLEETAVEPETESLVPEAQLVAEELPPAVVNEPTTVEDLEHPAHDDSFPEKSEIAFEQPPIEVSEVEVEPEIAIAGPTPVEDLGLPAHVDSLTEKSDVVLEQSPTEVSAIDLEAEAEPLVEHPAAEELPSATVEEPSTVQDLAEPSHGDSPPEQSDVALEQPPVEVSAVEVEAETEPPMEQLAAEELPSAAVEESTTVEDPEPSHDDSLPKHSELEQRSIEVSAVEPETEPVVSTEQLPAEEPQSAAVEEPITVHGSEQPLHDESVPEDSEVALEQPKVEESPAEPESLVSTEQLPVEELRTTAVEEPIAVEDPKQPLHDESLPEKSEVSLKEPTIEEPAAEPESVVSAEQLVPKEIPLAAVEEPTTAEDLAQLSHDDIPSEKSEVALEQPTTEDLAVEPEIEHLGVEELPSAAVEEQITEDLAQPSPDESLLEKSEVPLEQPEESAVEAETEPFVSTEQLAAEELPSAAVEESITVKGPEHSSHDDSLPEKSKAPLEEPTVEESTANPSSVVAETAADSIEEETATEPSQPTEQSEPEIVEQPISTLDESPSKETSVEEQTSSPETAIVEDAIPTDSAEITVVEPAPTAEEANVSHLAHVQEPSLEEEETAAEEPTTVQEEPSVLQDPIVALDEDVPVEQPIFEQTESKQDPTEADHEIFIEEAEAVDATLSPEDLHEMLPSPSTESSTVDPDESFATSGPFALESVMSSIGEETDDIDDNDPVLDVDSKVSEAENDILHENENGHYSTSDFDLSEPVAAIVETDKDLLAATEETTNGHSHMDADPSVVEVPSAVSEPLSTALETEKSALSALVSSEEVEPSTVETLASQEPISTSGDV